jgi:hypothetical protein
MNLFPHFPILKKTAVATAAISLLTGTSPAQDAKEKDSRTANAVTKATNAAEAVLKKLPSIPGAADAKVINIHIGDNYTFGFDEGVDAEEWGMIDNQTEGGQAADARHPAAAATPNEKPPAYRKLDFRKGDVVLIATEQPVDAPRPSTALESPAPAPNTTDALNPTPTPAPVATP